MTEKNASQVGKSLDAQISNKKDSSYHILVVDDDDATRQLTVQLLASSGYEIEIVKDGAAAWKALLTKDYDLVLTDNNMPNMTGIEMIEMLRSSRMAVPVIMATGNLPVGEFASKPWLTPDATLQRPYSNKDLLDTVKKVLHTVDSNKTHMDMLVRMYV